MLIHNSIKVFTLGMLSLSAFIANGQVFNEILLSQGDSVSTISTDGFGSGVSFYDFNQDGWDDISFAMENDTQVIYQNNQGVLQAADFSIQGIGQTKMLLWVDYDDDGDLDLFSTARNGRVRLWMNDGFFSFTDVTVSAGISNAPAANFGASFGDYDKDGDLDFYLCRHLYNGDPTNLNDVNNLYENNGDGTFTNVTWIAGVADGIAPSFCSVWVDYNQDTWPDLFVINDRTGYKASLYVNNQDGTFTDQVSFAGIDLVNDDPMSASFADFDNDQDLDLFVSNTAPINPPKYPRLFVNQNDGTFLEEGSSFGLNLTNMSWGGLWIDYNNNGYQDLYVATGFGDNNLGQYRNYFMRNDYPNPFIDDTTIIQGSDSARSHAVAKGDLNRDGFYDMVVHVDSPWNSMLFQNSGNNNNFIKITLEGTVSNKMAIGTWIHVFVDTMQYSHYTYCGINYMGQNSQHQIFGLGNATQVDSVHIEYLSGILDKYYNLNVNQEYTFTEGVTNSVLNIELQGSNPFCEGDSVVLSVPNMLAYNWSTGDTTPSIVVYAEGTYSLSVLDSSGSPLQSNSLFLGQVAAPIITSQVEDLTCYNSSDGLAYLTVVNEGQDYDILWSNGLSGDTLLADSSGLYGYTYIDSFNCSSEGVIQVDAPFPLNIQVEIEPQYQLQQGSIQVAVNGGVPPYTILLDGIDIGNQLTPIDSGSYDLSVTDGNACHELNLVIVPYQDTTLISSVQELVENQIKISPNPFDQEILISIPSLNCALNGFRLVDVFGKTIIKKGLDNVQALGNNNWRLPVTMQLTQGIYYLEVATSCRTSQYKLMKK